MSRKKALYWIPLSVLILGFALMTIGWRGCRPVDGFFFSFTLLFALPAFFLYVLVAAILLRTEADSHELKRISILALFALVLFACGGAAVLNGFFDESEISVHDVQIVDRGYTRLSRSRDYFVWTESWRDGKPAESSCR